ncbi:hypothetical protein OBBRIDRAFT_423649 [Obba rivulosa]|uniref:Uncharacterized protein n=1 Tax=Obba rivulosa TaxID=1052685 RepID=A0A8E2DMD5_9APHY|nr:hypothetical protein OBBRIDRAFT_423649 [Obba rivulosa]
MNDLYSVRSLPGVCSFVMSCCPLWIPSSFATWRCQRRSDRTSTTSVCCPSSATPHVCAANVAMVPPGPANLDAGVYPAPAALSPLRSISLAAHNWS